MSDRRDMDPLDMPLADPLADVLAADCVLCAYAYAVLDNPDEYGQDAVREAARDVDAHERGEHDDAD